jgi:hypothetical protein
MFGFNIFFIMLNIPVSFFCLCFGNNRSWGVFFGFASVIQNLEKLKKLDFSLDLTPHHLLWLN